MGSRFVPIPEGLSGERLDVALTRLLGYSRAKAAELVESGSVLVDGLAVNKSERVVAGSILTLEIQEPREPMPAQLVSGMAILWDDDDVVVVDKPVGVAAHPSPGWTGPTVVGGLMAAGYRVSTSGAAERQGVVHRLDAGTSGVMAVAKSERAYTSLKRQFRERTVDKTYHAVVQGHPDPSSGTIDAPIDRHPTRDWQWAVVSGGRPSTTHYDTLEGFPHASLLEVHLETGRTHQIRVHMAALKHPCAGDLMYGADPVLAERLGLTRQWLHAMQLSFDHPSSGARVSINSSYPADLQHALDALRGRVGPDEVSPES